MKPVYIVLATFLAFQLLLPSAPAAAQDHPPLTGDALRAPVPQQTHATRGSNTPTRYQPSAFMAGHVAVQVIFVESDGTIEPSGEDWTTNQINAVTEQITAALNWWQDRLPDARLRFDLSTRVVASGYEPVTHGLEGEHLWIGDVLSRMGYSGRDYFEQAYAADDALRRARGADWATTLFVANSANDADGRFADGLFGYAYVNGPFMVLTSDAGPYGTSKMAAVVTHEMGHIFGALDQYASAATPCTEQSGYLNVANTNSQYNNCGTHNPSIMMDALPAYENRQIDETALGQLGYRDSDGDHIIDPMDTTPDLQITWSQAGSARPVVSGQAVDQPLLPARQSPVTINHIDHVEYRVNGGAWMLLPAADGSYNSASESISATLPLYDGQYAVELRAVNSIGNASTVVQRNVSISGVGADPGYTVSAPQISNTTDIMLALHAPANTRVQISEDAAFAAAAWQAAQPELPWHLSGEGTHTVYVRFQDANGLESPIYTASILIDTEPPTGIAIIRAGAPPLLQIDASDNESGVAALQITLSDGTSSDWQAFQPTMTLPDQIQSVQVLLRDHAGNMSAPLIAQHNSHVIYLPLTIGR
jgi:hypothetical protein